MTISRAIVTKVEKDTKTHRARAVDLNDRAFAVLQCQKTRTFLRSDGTIFVNEVTGRPYPDPQIPRRRWTWALKALGMRHREAYQTRHSYATWLIMAYVPDKLVAEQLGHSGIVLHKIYSKQLVAAKDDKKREKINAALGFATDSPPKSAESQEVTDYKVK